MAGPKTVGGYTLVRELGRGGMGVVFEGTGPAGERVAVKVMQSELLRDLRARERFEREARAAMKVTHANVIGIRAIGDHQGAPFLVLELATGGSLAALSRGGGPLPWREAAALGAQVARGLAAIHGAGIVHRDLKPQNLLLEGGRCLITDFGLARDAVSGGSLTRTGEMLGTLEYAAPELSGEGRADFRADLYSLGATLYYLVAGEPPFRGTGYELVKKHLVEKPRSLRTLRGDVPPALDALVLRLLAKEPAARGASAAAVAAELEKIGAARGARRAWPLVAGAALVAATAAGAILAWPKAPAPPPPAPPPAVPPPPPAVGETELDLDLTKGFARSKNGWLALTRQLGCYDWKFAGEVWAISVSASGDRALAVDDRGWLHVISLARGHEGREIGAVFFGPVTVPRQVNELALLADPRYAVTADRSGLVRRWDLVAGTPAAERQLHDAAVTALALSPDRKRAFSGAADGTLALWDTETLVAGAPFPAQLAGIQGVALLPDGRHGLTTSGKTLALWDLETRSIVASERAPCLLTSVSISKDGRLALTGGSEDDHAVKPLACLWSIDGRTLERRTQTELADTWLAETFWKTMSGVGLSPDGKLALVSTTTPGMTAHLFDPATGETFERFPQGHTSYAAVFTPDGKMGLVAGGDGRIGFYALDRDRPRDLRPRAIVRQAIVAVSPKRVATGSIEGAVLVYDLDRKGKKTGNVEVLEDPRYLEPPLPRNGTCALAFNGDELLWACGSYLERTRIHERTEERVRGLDRRYLLGERYLHEIAISNGLALCAGEESTIWLYSLEADVQVRELAGHGSNVCFVAFTGNGTGCVSASLDGTMRWWNLSTNGNLDAGKVTLGSGPCSAGALAPDEKVAVLGLRSGAVDLVRLADRGQSHLAKIGPDEVRSVAISPTGGLVAACGGPSLSLIRIEPPEVLDSLDFSGAADEPMSLAFGDDGALWVGTYRGVVFRFDVRRR